METLISKNNQSVLVTQEQEEQDKQTDTHTGAHIHAHICTYKHTHVGVLSPGRSGPGRWEECRENQEVLGKGLSVLPSHVRGAGVWGDPEPEPVGLPPAFLLLGK